MSKARKKLNRRCRGIFLVELLVVLGIIAAVLLLTAEIASTSTRAAADATRHDAVVSKMDAMIQVLRKDIWSAARMHTTAGEAGAVTLELEEGNGGSTRWQFVPPAAPSESAPEACTVTRTSAGGIVRVWQTLPTLQVAVEGPLVTVEVAAVSRHKAPGTGSREEAVERMTFASQRRMAGDGR